MFPKRLIPCGKRTSPAVGDVKNVIVQAAGVCANVDDATSRREIPAARSFSRYFMKGDPRIEGEQLSLRYVMQSCSRGVGPLSIRAVENHYDFKNFLELKILRRSSSGSYESFFFFGLIASHISGVIRSPRWLNSAAPLSHSPPSMTICSPLT